MSNRLFTFLVFLIFHSTTFSQTVVWNDQKKKGTILFDNEDITILVVRYEKTKELTRAAEIYNKNLSQFQGDLNEILENSGIKYQLIFRSEFYDSTYADIVKYPIVIDHGLHMARSNGALFSFLHLWVMDRRTDFNARVSQSAQSTKYSKVFRKFFRKVKKGKRIKLYLKK
jgi:hypothetical protein